MVSIPSGNKTWYFTAHGKIIQSVDGRGTYIYYFFFFFFFFFHWHYSPLWALACRTRVSWLAHLERMEEDRMPKKIFTQELEGTRRRGRPRKGWKEEVERDLQVLGVRRWRELVADRKKWKDIVRQAKARRCEMHNTCPIWIHTIRWLVTSTGQYVITWGYRLQTNTKNIYLQGS